jgi:hypothetical protein
MVVVEAMTVMEDGSVELACEVLPRLKIHSTALTN